MENLSIQREFAIRFYKSDGTNWVANFQSGWTDFKEVHEFKDNKSLLVIACGACYMMNPEQTKLLSVFGVGYGRTFRTHDERLILQDQTDLTIIEVTENIGTLKEFKTGE